MFKTDALPEGVTTIPEALADAGYVTAGFVTNYNVAPYFDFDQGFDEYRYLEPELVLGANDTESRLALYSVVRLFWERFGSMKVSRFYRDARETTDTVLEWLGRRDERAPFFLFVGYMDPHDPYFRHPYDGTAVARVSEPNPAPSRAAELRRLYDGEVRFWDHHFGRLLAKMRSMPGKDGRSLLDDTVVVVTADHGEEFAEHGGFWHGTTLYDEAVHVPLVVRFPRNGNFPADAGVHREDWVRHVDLAPTVLAMAGREPAAGMQGRSFLETGETPLREPVFAEEDHEGNRLMSVRIFEDGVERKLILANEGNPRGLAPEELYAITSDPGEAHNVASSSAEVVGRLEGTLGTLAHAASEGAARQRGLSLDDGSEERLRSLGYAGAGDRPAADAGPDAH
jgi:arylsulfatase A-like enzyme